MKTKDKKVPIADDFRILLRKSGFKVTPARLAVLRFINEAKNPLSAQEMVEHFKNAVDQATIYRIFQAFKSNGIIRQVDLRHNHAHYELANQKEHHHLICLGCGRIEDIQNCGVAEMQKNILQIIKNFAEIRQHSLEFYGVCKNCADHEKKFGDLDVVKNKMAPI